LKFELHKKHLLETIGETILCQQKRTSHLFVAGKEKLGVTNAAEVEVESLASRIRDEITATNSVTVSPLLIGAWAQRQG
jgi:hypothetical protein